VLLQAAARAVAVAVGPTTTLRKALCPKQSRRVRKLWRGGRKAETAMEGLLLPWTPEGGYRGSQGAVGLNRR
jgi:hypothetical protein